ncbi:DUF6214 family protein [Streptomyces sp. NBC_01497]
MTARTCDEYTVQGLPVWEVQGYGTVTDAGRDVRPPWLDVRLTLPDGARVDVLAVVQGDTIAIEDAQADPPLPLAGLAALASALDAPLQAACASVTGSVPVPPDGPTAPIVDGAGAGAFVARAEEPPAAGQGALAGTADAPPEPSFLPAGPGPFAVGPAPDARQEASREAPADRRAETAGPTFPGSLPESVAQGCDAVRPEAPRTAGAAPPPAAGQGALTNAGPEPAPGPEPSPDPDRARTAAEVSAGATGRHRGRAVAPWGAARRRDVVGVYRAAQSRGQDPVLAVMAATGFSRRRSLRLIAGARDEGQLPSRRRRA